MQPRVRIGLIVGAIGLVLNICASGLFGVCGPLLSLIAGGVAGYFAVQREKPTVKQEGRRVGATSGGIAGGLMILGQIIGGIGALFYIQSTGGATPFGTVPPLSGDPAALAGFYLGGLGTGVCFGIIGALLAAGAGAGVGYFTTQDQPAAPPPQEMMS